jgi:hypothetical protein
MTAANGQSTEHGELTREQADEISKTVSKTNSEQQDRFDTAVLTLAAGATALQPPGDGQSATPQASQVATGNTSLEAPLTPEQRQKAIDDNFEIYADQQKTYDKLVVTLAGGALGISISFIKNIAMEPPRYPRLIEIAWLLWCLALAVALTSHAESARICFKKVQDLCNGRTDVDGPRKLLSCLNRLSGGFVVAGIACAAVFATFNLEGRTNVTEKRGIDTPRREGIVEGTNDKPLLRGTLDKPTTTIAQPPLARPQDTTSSDAVAPSKPSEKK